MVDSLFRRNMLMNASLRWLESLSFVVYLFYLYKNLAYTWSLIFQDMTLQTPAQEIVAKDLNGFEWHFRHIYRGKFRLFSFLSKISDSVATIY